MEKLLVLYLFLYLCSKNAKDMQDNKPITQYKQALKEQILDTAMKAFAKNGIKAVKMSDIAQSLNISKRTLYEIYENKELLLLEGMKKVMAAKQQETVRCSEACKNVMDIILSAYRVRVETLRTTNPDFYTDLEKYPSVLAFLNADRERSRKNLVGFVKRGVSEGYFRKDIDYQMVILLFDAISLYVRTNRLYQQFSVEDIFKNLPLFLWFKNL